jgi:hypothetical protein
MSKAGLIAGSIPVMSTIFERLVMTLQCETCFRLAMCKALSREYNPELHRINPDILEKCLYFYTTSSDITSRIDETILLNNIRVFLRPDLDYLWFGRDSEEKIDKQTNTKKKG